MRRNLARWVLAGWTGVVACVAASTPVSATQPIAPPAAVAPPCPPSPSTACPSPVAEAAGSSLELEASFLLWWTRSQSTPPLVTGATNPADLGILGVGSSTTLLGGNLSDSPLPGGRFGARFFLDESIGIEARGFFLEDAARSWTAANSPLIAVPFLDPTNGAEAALRLQSPQAAVGSASVRLARQNLWGIEANANYRIGEDNLFHIDLLGGFRYLQLREGLSLSTITTPNSSGFFAGQVTPAGSTYLGTDSFSTVNHFYGGQLGARSRLFLDRFVVEASAAVALGTINQQVHIAGNTTLQAPGLPLLSAPGNILTQTTNIGTHRRNAFGVIPQAGLLLGYQCTDLARVMVGYDFLFINDVLRPGDQIDRRVNTSLAPIGDNGARTGPAQPSVNLQGADFWAQGLTFSLFLSF